MQVCHRCFSKRVWFIPSVIFDRIPLPNRDHSIVQIKTISLSNSPLDPLINPLAGMANAPLDPELIKVYEAVEAALFKVHDAQSDNNNPTKTKEDTNRHLAAASDSLAQIKKDITKYV
jgi:hypothetical protein